MVPTLEQLEAVAPLKWAAPYLTSEDWIVLNRYRGFNAGAETDRFPRDTMRAYDGVQIWIELYQKPSPGSTIVEKSISIIKYGPGLYGFPGIAHGGAVMTMMDEAMGWLTVANRSLSHGVSTDKWSTLSGDTEKLLAEGKPVQEVLRGNYVTAKLDMKFLKPAPCPGIVGIEVELLDYQEHKLKVRGTMKDENGTPLVQADAIWVTIGGKPRL